jgi:hypothetical protein
MINSKYLLFSIIILSFSLTSAYEFGYNYLDKPSDSSTTYYPSTFVTLVGTNTSDNVTYIKYDFDGLIINISETTGTPSLDVRINFTGIDSFNNVIMRIQYEEQATAHDLLFQIWHYDTASWVTHYDIPDLSSLIVQNFYVSNSDVNVQNGLVQTRFYHPDTGNINDKLIIDNVNLLKGTTAITVNDHDALSNRNNILTNHPNILDVFYTESEIDAFNFWTQSELLNGTLALNSSLSDYWKADTLDTRNYNTSGDLTVDELTITSTSAVSPYKFTNSAGYLLLKSLTTNQLMFFSIADANNNLSKNVGFVINALGVPGSTNRAFSAWAFNPGYPGYQWNAGQTGTGNRYPLRMFAGTDATQLYLDNSTNSRVGIGTATPSYKFDVNGDAGVSGTIYNNNILSSDVLSLSTPGSESVQIMNDSFNDWGTIEYGSAIDHTPVFSSTDFYDRLDTSKVLDGDNKVTRFNEEATLKNYTDYSKPEIEYYLEEQCHMYSEDNTTCELVPANRTIYPYEKQEAGRNTGMSIDINRIMITDLKSEVEALKTENQMIKDCIKNSLDFKGLQECIK